VSNHKNRTVHAVSFNPAEEEMLQVLMAGGGYVNFSEFAKAKILGDASENEKRLRDVESAIQNMQTAYERHHNRWVQTAKSVSGADAEPLVAGVYALLHMMASQQARDAADQNIDLKLVKMAIEGENNGYRRHTHAKDGKGAQNAVYTDLAAKDERDIPQENSQKSQLNPYQAGKQKAPEKWSLFGRQPSGDQK
jgi:hypothetical protein